MNVADAITLTLTHHIDARGEYDAFYCITACIRVQGDEVGHISAVIIDRRRIPRGMFLSAMDGHSSELQEMSVTFFESKLGRTRIRRLREDGQDANPIMYIEEMHVSDEYKLNNNSDVGSYALHQFLRHPFINSWKSCMCLYILDAFEAMDPQLREQVRNNRDMERTERRQLLKPYQRLDANQFLRNGFYQDETIASIASHCVVAARSHWEGPLKSHEEVIRVQFYVPPPTPDPPTGLDKDILELTKAKCQELSMHDATLVPQATVDRLMRDLAELEDLIQQAVQLGGNVDAEEVRAVRERARQLQDDFNQANNRPLDLVAQYREEVQRLIDQGGNLSRSNALHAACAYDESRIVRCILSMDYSTLESRDMNDITPLMMAAEVLSGKCTIRGFPQNHAVIDMLLASGANKDATNRNGLTAYGMFVKQHEAYNESMYAMMGRQIPNPNATPGYEALKEILVPTSGPNRADRTGGDSENAGLIHYDVDEMNIDDEDGDY